MKRQRVVQDKILKAIAGVSCNGHKVAESSAGTGACHPKSL